MSDGLIRPELGEGLPAPESGGRSRFVFWRTLSYFKGISVRRGVIHIRRTARQVPIDLRLLGSVLAGVRVYLYLFAVKVVRSLALKRSLESIAFVPDMPAPWYSIWMGVQIAGLRTQSDVAGAEFVFVFEDVTVNAFDASRLPADVVRINHRISDITKQHVGEVFEQVFGYAIDVDPLTFEGEGVCKSNLNGVHDGVRCSFPLREDEIASECVYQRFVDSSTAPGVSEDLRIAYVLGEIPVVYHKFKDEAVRFGTDYRDVDLCDVGDVFSDQEVDLLIRFCEEMGLDFGTVDVMRDTVSGRIYVVDVNKTCMPVLSLSFREQMAAQRRIAIAFLKGLDEAAASLGLAPLERVQASEGRARARRVGKGRVPSADMSS